MFITVLQNGVERKIQCNTGDRLSDILGDYLHLPCGGRGTCKNCTVKVDGSKVLSCQTFVKKPVTVKILDLPDAQIVKEGISRNAAFDKDSGVGLAIDIGTTTIAAYCVDLATGKIVASLGELNMQRRFGSDVVSRIGCDHTLLHSIIAKQISSIVEKFGYTFKKALAVGNTPMLHFLQGYSAKSLAVAPFTPVSTEMKTWDSTKLGISQSFPLTVAPGISAFVGGDTVAAIIACSMDLDEKTALLVDIGTNGEIVLSHKGRLYCCSTAAGPAFEGAHITHGMGSVEGAISKVKIQNGIHIETIGGKPPVGICGSGIIDAVAQMLKYDIIDSTGLLDFDFHIKEGIYINQQDIRQVQYAKAAIYAGIETLARYVKVGYKDIETVYIAGGMGNYLDIKNAAYIGLFPKELTDKVVFCGNAAGSGAISMLLSDKIRKTAKKLAAQTEYIELSSSSLFQEEYIKQLSFSKV